MAAADASGGPADIPALAAQTERARKDLANFRARGDVRADLAEEVFAALRGKLAATPREAHGAAFKGALGSETGRLAKRLRQVATEVEQLGVRGGAATMLDALLAD